MNTQETKQILRLICAAYPTQRQKMQPRDLHAMLEVWCLALADVDFEVAKAAAGRIVCTSKWLPSIAEFRAEVGTVQSGGSGGRSGLDAWGDVRKLATFREDSGAGVDPIVLQVCQRFDWIKFRELWRNGETILQWHVMPGDNEESDRIRFAQLYDSLAQDARKQGQLAPGGKIPQLGTSTGPRQLGDIVRGMLPSGDPS